VTGDQQKIRDEALKRGISRLCHFTQSRKLSHILSDLDGVWATSRIIEKAPDLLDQTDNLRLDGQLDHICCSVEYPNTWYLSKIRDKDPLFKDWVVVFLKPALLWRDRSLFSPRNAAAHTGTLIQGGYAGFSRLFDQSLVGAGGRTFSRTAEMLPCCPTDDQAEVLVYEHIQRSNILGIGVLSEAQARVEKLRLSFIPSATNPDFYVAPDIFTGRWSNLIRRGQRPKEVVFSE
jgi:hypothetical protein